MKAPPRSHGVLKERAQRSSLARKVVLPSEEYIHSETISGILLLIAALLALIWVNSPWRASYYQITELPIHFIVGTFTIEHDLKHWINDGLMAIFFFMVALEIKRETLFGELSSMRKAALPVSAALGGMIVPVAIYLSFNWQGNGQSGWAIPMATDIAFAVAVLALLGNRAPSSLRLFLLAFAIVDDIGSILVIALAYTQQFSAAAAGVAAGMLGLILVMRWMGVRSTFLYFLPAVLFWGAVLKSGVHATIAGVILGFITPTRAGAHKQHLVKSLDEWLPEVRDSLDREEDQRNEVLVGQLEELVRETESPLARLERIIRPWVNYTILPLFALANAGVELSGDILREAVSQPVTQGIVAGLVLGKLIGLSGFAFLAVKIGWAQLPEGVRWRHLLGVGLIGGIGFTVSLFLTGLAFSQQELIAQAKIGVLAGSTLAGLLAIVYMFLTSSKEDNRDSPQEKDSRKENRP